MPIKPFKDLSLVDDFMFSEVMRRPENIKPFLEALLEKKIRRVVTIDKQKDLKDTYDTHGIRLDVYLEDENQTKYDVEVQAHMQRKLEKRISLPGRKPPAASWPKPHRQRLELVVLGG